MLTFIIYVNCQLECITQFLLKTYFSNKYTRGFQTTDFIVKEPKEIANSAFRPVRNYKIQLQA